MCKRPICYLSCILALAMAQVTLGDLVAHWALNEGVGSQVMDSTGNGNTGNISGNPTWINGVFGGALEFHGLGAAGGGGDYINCGANAILDITTNISIALWIRPDADQPESKGTETAPMAKAMSNMSPSWSYQVRYGWGSTSPYMAFTFNTSPRAWAYVGRNLNRYEWCHIACAHDGSTLRCYVNGEETGSTAMGAITASSCPVLIGSDGWGCDWIGAIDDVRIYNHGLTADELKEILAGGGVEQAKDPIPADAATDVPCDIALSWTAGAYAATHDVYLGTTFDDVNNVGRDNAGDLLVSQDQEATEYDPENPLDYGQTYYWRVDEVNAAPDNTIFKGTVWSFTTEPYGYPMTGVTAKASNEQTASPAVRTVDGSGLDDLDQHGVDVKTMWVGSMPASIVYTFDKEYKLHELWVWNANSEIEAFMGFGVKDVTVEYSTDGETWVALENVPEFAQATGTATYAANTVVSFGGVVAKYVRLTVNAAYGATGIVGLSEVRFFYVPMQAFGPDPADGATGVSVDAELGWRPGREATSHTAYVDVDEAAV
ncbi:MAG: LamG-like jellyroll fold domain-containing protein, partial [Phycisphaerales bacterium]